MVVNRGSRPKAVERHASIVEAQRLEAQKEEQRLAEEREVEKERLRTVAEREAAHQARVVWFWGSRWCCGGCLLPVRDRIVTGSSKRAAAPVVARPEPERTSDGAAYDVSVYGGDAYAIQQ